jgi:2-oxoglutarate ferredoxin oxidoreductase subunit delta
MAESETGVSSQMAHGARPAKVPLEIQIKVSWCKGCGLCVDYCNRGVLEMRDGLPVVLQAEKCSRCLMCEVICPDFAITVSDAGAGPVGGGERGGPTT